MKSFLYIKLVVLIVLCCSVKMSIAQSAGHTFEKLDSLIANDSKNTLVYIYTDWCKYCMKMSETSLKDKEVQKQLSDNFHYVKLNAETKENIDFHGKTFQYKPSGINTGLHELAIELGSIKGDLNYPSICVLNDQYEIIYQSSGYLNTKEMLKLLSLL